MKLSIWQQFSSNHSSEFIVIGRFEDETTANKIADELRQWMQDILWGEDYKTAENNLKEAYKLEWYENGLDWNGLPDNIDEVVKQFQTDVFLLCPIETWDSHTPFLDLITKMGSLETIANRSGDGYSEGLLVDIFCESPSEATTSIIYNIINTHIEEENKDYKERSETAMTWAKFRPNYDKFSEKVAFADYDKLEAIFVDEENQRHLFLSENYESMKRKRQRDDILAKTYKIGSQSFELQGTISAIRSHISLDRGKIERTGRKLQFSFASYQIDLGIIALVRWLEALDCNVTYEFRTG